MIDPRRERRILLGEPEHPAQQILEVSRALRQRLVDIGIAVHTVAIDHRIEPVSLEDVERFVGVDILGSDVGG